MINILLEAYIAKSNLKSKISWLHFIIAILTMILSLVFLILSGMTDNILLIIFDLISTIGLYIDIALWERKNLKQYQVRFEERNQRINFVKEVLTEFKYNDNNPNENWYSAEKIKHLIQSGEAFIEKYKKSNTKLLDLGKTIIFPIVAFVAGVISNNSSVMEAMGIAFITLFLLVIFYLFAKIISFITDMILKSSSVNEMNNLVLLLKDLLARDFE